MRHNFNTAPTQTAEIAANSWDFGRPISSGIQESSGGYSGWSEPATADSSAWDSGWSGGEQSSLRPTAIAEDLKSRLGERLSEMKDKIVRGIGRKALDAVMNRLPTFQVKESVQGFATTMYEDPYARQNFAEAATAVRSNFGGYHEHAAQFAMSAGREVAGAGSSAAKEAVMSYYGLEKGEDEKLRIARKIKFGKAAVKTVINPISTATSVGVRAGRAVRKASLESVKNQASFAKDAALSWLQLFEQPPTPADARDEYGW